MLNKIVTLRRIQSHLIAIGVDRLFQARALGSGPSRLTQYQ